MSGLVIQKWCLWRIETKILLLEIERKKSPDKKMHQFGLLVSLKVLIEKYMLISNFYSHVLFLYI